MSVALIKVRAACARFGLLRGVRRVAVADSGAAGEMLLEALTALGRDGGFAVLPLKAAGGPLDELCAEAATLGCDALALPDTLDDAIDARYLCAGKPAPAAAPLIAVPDRPAIIISGLRHDTGELGAFLDLVQAGGASIPVRSMVTPTSKGWMLANLLLELNTEHETVQGEKA